MGQIVGSSGWLFHVLLTVGLFGLVASFHGLILAAGRSSYELGAKGFAPRFLGQINERFQTPAKALLANMGIGIIALFTNQTAEIITISVMGALTLYSIAMLSLLRLRKKNPTCPGLFGCHFIHGCPCWLWFCPHFALFLLPFISRPCFVFTWES